MTALGTLTEVVCTDAVLQNCLAHSFTTEREEIMGVLLGEVVVQGSSKKAHVWGSKVIQRKDKRSDRVEIAPEHLCTASEEADRCTQILDRRTRVIGWYHSHPHITPYPSHVDLKCQQSFQYLESGWVGLIFSVFNSDSQHTNAATIHCFRTRDGVSHEKVPLVVVPSSAFFTVGLAAGCEMPSIMKTFRQESQEICEEKLLQCSGSGASELKAVLRNVTDSHLFSFRQLVGHSALDHLEGFVIPALEERLQRLKLALEEKATRFKHD